MRRIITLLMLIVASATVSCSKKDPEPAERKIESIRFSEDSYNVLSGSETAINLIHSPSDMSSPDYVFTSSDTTVAVVYNGNIIAKKVGTTEISATFQGSTLVAKIKVTVLPVSPEKLTITSDSSSILVGNSVQLKYTIDPPNTTDIGSKRILWESSNDSIATVSPEGVFKAVKPGKATVTASIEGTTIIGSLEIECKPILVSSIKFANKSVSLKMGVMTPFTYTILPENASDKSVTIESSDNNIVSVSNGNLVGNAPGKAKITIKTKDGSKQDIMDVEISRPIVSSIMLSTNTYSLQIGDEAQLYAFALPEQAENKNLTYTSSSKSIVTVDSQGKIKALSSGYATITITSVQNPNVKELCYITVSKAADLVTSRISVSSLVIIGNFVTGSVTSVLDNNSRSKVRYLGFQVTDVNGTIVSRNNEEQDLPAGNSISLTSRLNNVISPKFTFFFSSDGVRYERSQTLN